MAELTSRGIAAGSIGVWQQLADVNVARHLAVAGFDWIALDAQHGAIDRSRLIDLGRALGDVGANLVVRVPGVDPVWIGAALDAGASTVIVPTVNSVADAELVVRAGCYPPRGERSWGPYAILWHGDAPDPATADRTTQRFVMIETAQALADVDAIAAVEGIDGLFVGPFDLALSLGATVDDLLSDETSTAPLARVVAAAGRAGIVAAAFAGTPDRADAFRAQGIHALAVATDSLLLQLGSAAVLRRAP